MAGLCTPNGTGQGPRSALVEGRRRHGGAGECRAGWGPAGSVPVTLRAQLPQRSGTVQGLKLPTCMAARVQGSQIALGGPRVGGVQERERERGVLNARAWPAPSGLWSQLGLGVNSSGLAWQPRPNSAMGRQDSGGSSQVRQPPPRGLSLWPSPSRQPAYSLAPAPL